jgi:hypothetical protein
MAQVTDPCPNWAVFRMLDGHRGAERGSQISLLRDGDQSLLYCCHSRRTNDMAGNPHVLSVGIDLAPALRSHSVDSEDIVATMKTETLATAVIIMTSIALTGFQVVYAQVLDRVAGGGESSL